MRNLNFRLVTEISFKVFNDLFNQLKITSAKHKTYYTVKSSNFKNQTSQHRWFLKIQRLPKKNKTTFTMNSKNPKR